MPRILFGCRIDRDFGGKQDAPRGTFHALPVVIVDAACRRVNLGHAVKSHAADRKRTVKIHYHGAHAAGFWTVA